MSTENTDLSEKIDESTANEQEVPAQPTPTPAVAAPPSTNDAILAHLAEFTTRFENIEQRLENSQAQPPSNKKTDEEQRKDQQMLEAANLKKEIDELKKQQAASQKAAVEAVEQAAEEKRKVDIAQLMADHKIEPELQEMVLSKLLKDLAYDTEGRLWKADKNGQPDVHAAITAENYINIHLRAKMPKAFINEAQGTSFTKNALSHVNPSDIKQSPIGTVDAKDESELWKNFPAIRTGEKAIHVQ